MQGLLEFATQMEADPTATDTSEVFLKLGQQKAEQLVRDAQDVQDWFRRNCGPETADSAWCEAFTKAKFDSDLALVSFMFSPNPTNILGSVYQQSLALFRAILGAAPPDVAPKVQLLIDQYERNGGKPPQDKQAVSDSDAARDAIIASVRDQCGITMKRSEF